MNRETRELIRESRARQSICTRKRYASMDELMSFANLPRHIPVHRDVMLDRGRVLFVTGDFCHFGKWNTRAYHPRDRRRS